MHFFFPPRAVEFRVENRKDHPARGFAFVRLLVARIAESLFVVVIVILQNLLFVIRFVRLTCVRRGGPVSGFPRVHELLQLPGPQRLFHVAQARGEVFVGTRAGCSFDKSNPRLAGRVAQGPIAAHPRRGFRERANDTQASDGVAERGGFIRRDLGTAPRAAQRCFLLKVRLVARLGLTPGLLSELGVHRVRPALQRLFQNALVFAPTMQRVHQSVNLVFCVEHPPPAIHVLHEHASLHASDAPPVSPRVSVLPQAFRTHAHRVVLLRLFRLLLPLLLFLEFCLFPGLLLPLLLSLLELEFVSALLVRNPPLLRLGALVPLALRNRQPLAGFVVRLAPRHQRLAVLGMAVVRLQVFRELEGRFGGRFPNRRGFRFKRRFPSFLVTLIRIPRVVVAGVGLVLRGFVILLHGSRLVIVPLACSQFTTLFLLLFLLLFLFLLILHLLPSGHRGLPGFAFRFLLASPPRRGFCANGFSFFLGCVFDFPEPLRLGVVRQNARVPKRLRVFESF